MEAHKTASIKRSQKFEGGHFGKLKILGEKQLSSKISLEGPFWSLLRLQKSKNKTAERGIRMERT